MGRLYDLLVKDIRFEEGLKACINCGTCTAICAAAEFYNYDPREIAIEVQTKDEKRIETLLKSETIWYCGECMSCKTRCPRGNAPGLIIMALRSLAQDLGYFTESEKGRQQLALKRTIGESILETGYCVHASHMNLEMFPEQGPVWEWEFQNLKEVFDRMGGNYEGRGAGALRKMDEETMKELHQIFEVTGGMERFDKIENFSKAKAMEMGIDFESEKFNTYFNLVFNHNSGVHTSDKE